VSENVLPRSCEVGLTDGSYEVCPEQDEEQFTEGTKRSLLPVSKSTVYNKVRGPILNRKKQGHTSEVLRRRADGNSAIPHGIVVVGQRDATGTGVPLARRYDATNKGVWPAGIPFIGDHAPSVLPGRKQLVYLPVHCNSGNHKELTQLYSGSVSHTLKDRRREG
jgi:hypothetical protein